MKQKSKYSKIYAILAILALLFLFAINSTYAYFSAQKTIAKSSNMNTMVVYWYGNVHGNLIDDSDNTYTIFPASNSIARGDVINFIGCYSPLEETTRWEDDVYYSLNITELSSQDLPNDFDSKFYNYYIKSNSKFVYLVQKPTDEEKEKNQYYSLESTLLKKKPDDWETNYSKYYKKDNEIIGFIGSGTPAYVRFWLEAKIANDETDYSNYFELQFYVDEENEIDETQNVTMVTGKDNSETTANENLTVYYYDNAIGSSSGADTVFISGIKFAEDAPMELLGQSGLTLTLHFDAVQAGNSAYESCFNDWKGYSPYWK